MCVSQFRNYCKASHFRHENRKEDLENTDLEIKEGTFRYADRSYYYVTDLSEMKKLANQGNEYAINHLKNTGT